MRRTEGKRARGGKIWLKTSTLWSDIQLTAGERPISAGERPISAGEGPIPASEGPISASEEAIPASEGPIPASEEPIPASEEPIPASEGGIPASEEPKACGDGLNACRDTRLTSRGGLMTRDEALRSGRNWHNAEGFCLQSTSVLILHTTCCGHGDRGIVTKTSKTTRAVLYGSTGFRFPFRCRCSV